MCGPPNIALIFLLRANTFMSWISASEITLIFVFCPRVIYSSKGFRGWSWGFMLNWVTLCFELYWGIEYSLFEMALLIERACYHYHLGTFKFLKQMLWIGTVRGNSLQVLIRIKIMQHAFHIIDTWYLIQGFNVHSKAILIWGIFSYLIFQWLNLKDLWNFNLLKKFVLQRIELTFGISENDI